MHCSKSKNIIGQLLLLSATVVWGTSFIVLKQAIEEVPMCYVIAIRFLLSSFILGAIFYKHFVFFNKKTLKKGIVLGLFLGLAYLTQTIGLKNTTPGRNAFITATYCVTAPFLAWLLFRERPRVKHVFSAVICLIGIGLVALSGSNQQGVNLLLGDGLTLVASLFFGLQVLYTHFYQTGETDGMVLLVIELLIVGVMFSVFSLVYELPKLGVSAFTLSLDQIMRILYLTLACTLYAQLVQLIGLKYTSSNQATIILSLEAGFGVLFSVLLGDEKMSATLLVGFIIIFISIIISEVDFSKKK